MKITRINTNHPAYPAVEQLFVDAFPHEERRELSLQRRNIDCNANFSLFLAEDSDGIPVGFITVWNFPDFRYVEHFATFPEFRNKGVGAQILAEIFTLSPTPILLEVELPESDVARRRIAFYQRNGFHSIPTPYFQPPYRPDFPQIPMMLMAHGSVDPASAVATLRSEVYNFS